MKKNTDLDFAYLTLNRAIISSDIYNSFLTYLFNNKLVNDNVVNFIKENSGSLSEAKQDIMFIGDVANKVGLENEFSAAIISAVRSNNAIENVINTKLVETMYGNSLKEDEDATDILFTLLEATFGLDAIIDSYVSKSNLVNRLNVVMKNHNQDFTDFNTLFNDIYEEVKDEVNSDEIIRKLSKYKAALEDYTEKGLSAQVNDVMNDSMGNYHNYDELSKRVFDIFNKMNAKIM